MCLYVSTQEGTYTLGALVWLLIFCLWYNVKQKILIWNKQKCIKRVLIGTIFWKVDIGQLIWKSPVSLPEKAMATHSCLENPMGRGDWWAAVHGVAKSRTWLSDFTFTFHFHALEKEMATHSSVLAWRIPRMAEPGGLPSMGTHRVGHDWSDLAAAAAVSLPHPREEIDIVVFLVFQHCFLRREKMKIDVIIKGFPGG